MPGVDLAAVCTGFDLGALREGRTVPGGLSNDMWHVRTDRGEYAIKAMVVNADQPDFVTNLEAAFAVERSAYVAGVPMPEPIAVPGSDRCLLVVDGRLTRAHAWVDATVADPQVNRAKAGTLLARIHAASSAADVALDDEPWTAAQWGELGDHAVDPSLADAIRDGADLLARLETATSAESVRAPSVNSHRDLDPKNVLVGPSGLLAVDWDAAGPVAAAREAVQVVLDWSTDPAGFAEVLAAYRSSSTHDVPAEPWVFGGWVSAHGGWLVYNASNRSDTSLGVDEARAALARLRMLSAHLPAYVSAL
jgi:Phosphotransferase enzyme family